MIFIKKSNKQVPIEIFDWSNHLKCERTFSVWIWGIQLLEKFSYLKLSTFQLFIFKLSRLLLHTPHFHVALSETLFTLINRVGSRNRNFTVFIRLLVTKFVKGMFSSENKNDRNLWTKINIKQNLNCPTTPITVICHKSSEKRNILGEDKKFQHWSWHLFYRYNLWLRDSCVLLYFCLM